MSLPSSGVIIVFSPLQQRYLKLGDRATVLECSLAIRTFGASHAFAPLCGDLVPDVSTDAIRAELADINKEKREIYMQMTEENEKACVNT